VTAEGLAEAVADVYGDRRLDAVLRHLLRHTARLTGSAAGSVSLIDAAAGRYTKAAEFGAHCRLGATFPLDEGATGRAFGSRRPVAIPDYGQLRAGHLADADPVRRGPAAAVPIWWRGDVIAVSVVFATALSTQGMDDLEVLVQTAAAAIMRTGRTGGAPATARGRCARAAPAGPHLSRDRLAVTAVTEDRGEARRRDHAQVRHLQPHRRRRHRPGQRLAAVGPWGIHPIPRAGDR
jgi:GAF domain-containing protein